MAVKNAWWMVDGSKGVDVNGPKECRRRTEGNAVSDPVGPMPGRSAAGGRSKLKGKLAAIS